MTKQYRRRYCFGMTFERAAQSTYRERLYELAMGQNGYVTTDDAAGLGIPPVQLRLLAGRHGLTHIAHGLYRFDAMPVTATDEYLEAVLRVGRGAYLSHDAVLALHGLALVNPTRLRVGTNRRPRRQQSANIEVVWRTLPDCDLTAYEGIPSATVRRALLDCRELIMRERLVTAIDEAATQGLLTASEAVELNREIG